ncbi:nuclear transport factor 2 family protein [Alteraurantiacibacter buctensis]|uniref:Nuclear transport factor 2 family protein n=1 Tax=Alteraurantiacibacter buctensis TaxID=1503981 RepID=A0A844YP33_9SPHN|nr:nuclear transport factor 2 family protein [Alteraurantiacibacter buctensis]MXO70145.1 nuclear transport factor 2 family protein [Alteraurantiacibacter buctensis]
MLTPDQRRAIEADVTRLIHQYTWANDVADWTQCAALYTEDAVFRRPSGGEAIVGRQAILASFLARKPRAQRHAIANVLVDVVDEQTATAKSVIVLYMGDAAEDGGQETQLPVQDASSPLIGTFADRCVLTADGWRFAERVGGLDFRP